jgi:hypothetical protein
MDVVAPFIGFHRGIPLDVHAVDLDHCPDSRLAIRACDGPLQGRDLGQGTGGENDESGNRHP